MVANLFLSIQMSTIKGSISQCMGFFSMMKRIVSHVHGAFLNDEEDCQSMHGTVLNPYVGYSKHLMLVILNTLCWLF
jgi:hypothetical protein